MGKTDEVREEILKLILSKDDFDYKSVFVSTEDGKDIIKEIEDFIDKTKDRPKKEDVKRLVFENPQNVGEENINDIIDALVRMRDGSTLTTVNGGSMTGVLVMFNRWINLEMRAPGQNAMPEVLVQSSMEYQPATQSLEETVIERVSTTISGIGQYTINVEGIPMYANVQPQAIYATSEFSMTGPVQPEDESARPELMYRPESKMKKLYNDDHAFVGLDEQK
jgi:hypothetical protein